MKYFVLTNNPMVQQKVAPGTEVEFVSCGIKQILRSAEARIAQGHRLLSHPLSGSVKPGETPYKSMLLSADAQTNIDSASVQLITNAIEACDKFVDKSDAYSSEVLHDLQVVDFSLISGALSSAQR